MKNTILTALMLAAALALGACSKSARLPQTVTLAQTRDEPSKDVSLVLGDVLMVDMPGNFAAGYLWELLPLPEDVAGLVLVEGRYTPPAEPSATGVPGKFTYVLRTVHVGVQQLEFVYRRQTERDKPPAKTFRVNAKVK